MQGLARLGIVLLAIAKSWLVRLLMLPWVLLGVYDLTLSQLVPEDRAKSFPKAFKLIEDLVNWMPWWEWISWLLVIFIVGVLEFVYKTSYKVSTSIGESPLPPTAAPMQIVPSQSAATHGDNSPVGQFGTISGSTINIGLPQPSLASLSPMLPDWTFFELFNHLVPYGGDDPNWQTITRQVMDALSLGRLKCWGREQSNRQTALEEIERGYWARAKFTMNFLDETKRMEAHTYPIGAYFKANGQSLSSAYTDLQVNRAQALALWPVANTSLHIGWVRGTYKQHPTTDNAKLLLACLRGVGVAHRNSSSLISDDQVKDWVSEATRWANEVADVLTTVDMTDGEMFKTLDVVTPARVNVPHQIKDRWNLTKFQNSYNQHDLRLAKLEKLLHKYQGVTP